MARYLAKRIFYLLLTLFIVITLTFFLMKLMPGTPLNNEAKLPPEARQSLYHQYGLDKPVWMQYLTYLGGVIHGNFGTSFQFSNQPVSFLIFSRIGVSLQLGLQGMVLGIIAGIIFGAISAIKKDTWMDAGSTVISILGISIPSFVLAILLQNFLGLKLGIFPISGFNGFKSTILPTLALSVSPFAQTSRFIRTRMVDSLNSDYIQLAKEKGLTQPKMIYHHALRNSLIPIVTIIGPLAVNIMTGSMVVENIFGIPGIGEQFVKSVLTNDYPTIMALTIIYSFMLCVVLLVTDILYAVIDPRIRINGKKA